MRHVHWPLGQEHWAGALGRSTGQEHWAGTLGRSTGVGQWQRGECGLNLSHLLEITGF